MFQRVYVIQEKRSGQFLTESLNFTKSLKRAGRLLDNFEAVETAQNAIGVGEYEISTFFEEVN